jgi:CheY-like chemotaxis protein
VRSSNSGSAERRRKQARFRDPDRTLDTRLHPQSKNSKRLIAQAFILVETLARNLYLPFEHHSRAAGFGGISEGPRTPLPDEDANCAHVTKPIDVLLAEDDVGDVLLVAKLLDEYPIPVKLHIARSGVDALLLLASGTFQPDLVILDLNMPNISGYGVIERFHADDVPMVVFSSSGSEADIRRALTLGAREYSQKPATVAAYREAVHGMVQKWVR